MWNLKYDTNEPSMKQKQKTEDIEDRLVSATRAGLGEAWSGTLGLAGQAITQRMGGKQGPIL